MTEIEEANFYLERRYFKRLMHDNNYDEGYILNFIPLDKA